MAKETEGLFNYVMADDDIHKAFSTIFDGIKYLKYINKNS